jgi:ribosome modulation factor
MNAYEEGIQACIDGKRKNACPYKGKKRDVLISRLAWLGGYADQAEKEADVARDDLARDMASA